ncbi:MAG: peptidoglycan DD-metalloendopeptidase family protein [Defluviitaleaceae bacterium]|nr:peptidoglycan DD-metalloendopeptidase family protein [Defluviitaleaceae bacterium]
MQTATPSGTPTNQSPINRNPVNTPTHDENTHQPHTPVKKPKEKHDNNLTSRALHKIDQLLPDDRENDAVQAIKHDVLETPAAILNATKEIREMRTRGRRTLFENKKNVPTVNNKTKRKKKDRLLRRTLDRGYIASQAAANMMPDEQGGEDSGTKGVRAMIQEGAKLVKIFATAERKPDDSKLRHNEQKLAHENIPDESRLAYNGVENKSVIILLHEDSDPKTKKLEAKIKKAEAKIPTKKVKITKLVHDEKSGKEKRKISFTDEKVEKPDAKWNQAESRTLSANAGRYVTGHASALVHSKISEMENLTGNTGVKAAHSGEKAAVKTYQTAQRVRRYVKNRPYRRLQHLKIKEAQNKGRLAYQQLLKNKPELRKNTLSRLIQKRRIKRDYAKAFRMAQSGRVMGKLGIAGAVVGAGAAAISGDGKALAKMGASLGLKIAFKKAGLALAKAAVPILLKIGGILLILGAILLLFTMCFSLLGSSTGYVLDYISYRADADEITEYSAYYTRLEVDLKQEILEAAVDVEGLHEFRFILNRPSGGMDVIFEGTLIEVGLGHPYFEPPVYDPPDFDPLVLLPFLSDITHDPFQLMAYLTAVYGDFDGHDIHAVLRSVFDTAFTFGISEGYEVRYAYVEAWYYELQDLGGYEDLGEWVDFGEYVDGVWVPDLQWVEDIQWVEDWQEVRVEPFEERLYFNWYYRAVTLTVNMTVSQVLQNRMNDEQKELYDVLMDSLGLRQFVGSPFENNWLGVMTSPYGYRFHPVYMERSFHTGIDIALPEGTPILSGAPGIVTAAEYMGGYGNTVIIEYVDEERGLGVRLLYSHMAVIHVTVGDELEMGEVIGTVGQTGTATGPHLHMEVSINEDGGAWRRINPLFFVQPYVS